MPNGTLAPGKVCPWPPVPMRGLTASAGEKVTWARTMDEMHRNMIIRILWVDIAFGRWWYFIADMYRFSKV
jgi:hypothetical protein